ncbi:glutathione S-transferase family protein [Pseudahrensia aquimaris]|uniref:Glutathione S-transferase family protein n=1 Tax=Pseudahrensia aquimaris TaxID=744461 RepID=A0ABW3FJA9_9HYPH
MGLIRVHHLNHSRSQRILWLLEEIGLDYEIITYKRDAKTNLAPPDLLAVHPLGKSPMIEMDGVLIAESGAIVEAICAVHAPQMVPEAGSESHIRHLEAMHFAEGSVMLPVLLALYTSRLGEGAAPLQPRIQEQLDSHFSFMEASLRESGHFVMDDLSAADVMMSFPAQVAVRQGRAGDFPKLAAFCDMIHEREAWKRSIERSKDAGAGYWSF